MKILGLDVGGAHIKSALVETGATSVMRERVITPFEIYKNKEKLPHIIRKIVRQARPDGVALTMTGELADVFPTRNAGARFILDSVVKAAKPVRVKVIDTNGDLIAVSPARKSPCAIASANWAATAKWVSQQIDTCIIVDIGSTTTDILPIINGAAAVEGRDDFERLGAGELLYTGYLRTNTAAVCPVVTIQGKSVPTCPEHFAIMGDAFLYLGEITAQDYTTPTPDNAPKRKSTAARRLARIVLSDPSKLGEAGITSIARQLINSQVQMIVHAVRRIEIERNIENAPLLLTGHASIYRKRLRRKISNQFISRLGVFPVNIVDPASCAAALWK
ncbi:4-[[4-(2-aminoethyl)phenoxy]-methyl]-2-furanmethanamine-glutamate synthase [hydrothermal vent metagenome]|uniref:4-[[4-(2-aminoethyl)phenoxy]-methyl]-2-furanmethanamine-glutamate synthase n=1 Tax=hydrothermal vent metagenome TaxID=652676 RepID=A0A3B1CNC8_9ZZZZ